MVPSESDCLIMWSSWFLSGGADAQYDSAGPVSVWLLTGGRRGQVLSNL